MYYNQSFDEYLNVLVITNLHIKIEVEIIRCCSRLCFLITVISCNLQVRTTGAYDPVTKQPVHGRKLGGGIRLGEMERDSIISHGAACLLQDRLFNCSDGSEVRFYLLFLLSLSRLASTS